MNDGKSNITTTPLEVSKPACIVFRAGPIGQANNNWQIPFLAVSKPTSLLGGQFKTFSGQPVNLINLN